MTCSKKTHTQRHGTLVVCTQVSSCSQLSQVITREMSHRAGSKRPGSQTVTKKPVSRRSTPLMFPSGFLCLDDRKPDDIELLKKKPTALPWCCVHIRPCCRTATGTFSSTVETTPSSHSDDVWSPVASDVAASAQQPQSNCLFATEKPTTHTMERANRGRDMRQKKHQFPVLRGRRGCKQPAALTGWTTNPPRQSVQLSCEVCEAHKASHSRFLEHVDVLQVIPHPYDLATARGKPQPRFGQKSTIRPSHSDNASLLSVSVSETSPFVPSTLVSRSPCRKFVSMVTVTMSCLTVS